MGHVGKQLFLVTAGIVPEQDAHTPAVFVGFCPSLLLPTELCFLAVRAFSSGLTNFAAVAAQVAGANQ